VDHTSTPSRLRLRPADALAPLWAGYCLRFPVYAEVCYVIAFASFRLPLAIFVGRSDEIDPEGVARNQVAATDVGGIRQLLGGQKPALRKPFLDGTKLFYVGGGGRSGADVGDQMRQPFVATLRQMHFVANPTHPSLGTVANLRLVGRFDAVGGFRPLFWVARPQLSFRALNVALLPELAQDLDFTERL
jgi:hypothetical protein